MNESVRHNFKKIDVTVHPFSTLNKVDHAVQRIVALHNGETTTSTDVYIWYVSPSVSRVP